MNMNTLATIHTKFQGETMFCFVCIATFFGYILGVNKVIECVIAKHSNNNIIIKTCNKYTQTNLNDLVEYLSSKNVIVEQIEKYSNKFRRSVNSENGVNDDVNNNVNNEHDAKDETSNNNNNANDDAKNENVEQTQEKEQEQTQEKEQEQTQEKVQSPPQSAHSDGPGSVHSNSNSEEDYEVVKKSENVSFSKNKIKFFEWFSIL